MDLSGALGLGDRELVAFVGAGGKKTAMRRLVDEADDRGLVAGYTTTTHAPPPPDLPLVLSGPDDLPASVAGRGPVAFAAERVSDPDRAAEKVRGYDPETVDALHDAGPFDWLLVKADGARRREFKAPGPDEPVVPRRSDRVVAVASVRAVGRPLATPTVHRPERVAAITGRAVGEDLRVRDVATVLASDAGGRKGVPAGASFVVLVNKADTPELRERGRAVVRAALDRSAGIERGLVASFEAGTLEPVEG